MTRKAAAKKPSPRGVRVEGSTKLRHPEPTRRRRNKSLADPHVAASTVAKPPRGRAVAPKKRRASASAPLENESSELIGRRVGRSTGNLERVQAKPTKVRKTSTKRGAAHGNRPTVGKHTAPRNAKLNTQGMTAALEDSGSGKPSRKSTRKSANRHKENQLTRRMQRKLVSPESRAARGA